MPISYMVQQHADSKQVEPGVLRYHIEYTSGAVGAIPAVLKRAKGIKSIVRTGVGVVVITLDQPAVDFVDFVAWVVQATPAAGGAVFVTNVDSVATSPATVTLTFRTSAFAAVDTLINDIVYVSFSVLTLVL